jgi:uncharacterized coiled-coil protein SlyX
LKSNKNISPKDQITIEDINRQLASKQIVIQKYQEWLEGYYDRIIECGSKKTIIF